MAFVYKAVKKDNKNYQKYVDFEQRYLEETPQDILKQHNYAYDHLGEELYRKIASITAHGATVISDDERKIYLVLIHDLNCHFDFDTPMAWVLLLENHMVLVNCDIDYEDGPLDNSTKWYKFTYLVQPLVLPNLLQNREEEIKQYILEALTVYSNNEYETALPIFKTKFQKFDMEVIFDQLYHFKGYNN